MFNGHVINFFNGKPMQGVSVSDGLNVVRTDADGKFSLPGHDKAKVVNVGLLTERHDDWYINVEGHEGDFDFLVKPVACGDNFSFLHISDTEIEGRSKNDWLDYARRLVKEENPLFFANTGDLCRADGLARHHLLMNSESFGCPVRYAIGNHDFTVGEYGEKAYEKSYGPTYYSFDCGKIHFVVLSMGGGDTPSLYSIDHREAWLKNDLADLAEDRAVIMLSHFFEPHPDRRGGCHTASEVRRIVGEDTLKACIFGHDHYIYSHAPEGVWQICSARPDSGGIDSSPAGARRIDVRGTTVTTEYLYNVTPSDDVPDRCEWQTHLSGHVEFSTPVEADGSVWVCTSDESIPSKCGIYKLDSDSGEISAFIETAPIKGDGVYCDGKFYAEDSNGYVYCIDGVSAEMLWRAKVDISDKFYTRTGVIVADGKIIAGSGKKVTAFDLATGNKIWENYDCGGCEGPSRCVYDQKRRQIIKARQWRCISAISVENGETLWENSERFCWFNTATPTLDDDVIIKRGHTGLGLLDAENGKTLKTVTAHSSFDVSGQCAVDGELVYIPTAQAGVFAYDKQTLEPKLAFSCGKARMFTAPYFTPGVQTVETTPKIVGEHLIFASSDGYIYVYDKSTARLHKKICVGSPVIAGLCHGDGYVISASFDGTVKKFLI